MQSPRPLYIFDLDGTLALIEHRVHYIKRNCHYCYGKKQVSVDVGTIDCPVCDGGSNPAFKPDWRAFFAACDADEPNLPVIDVMECLWASGNDVLIWSGRSDEVRDVTLAWLAKNTSFMAQELSDILTMRAAGDHSNDHDLKARWLAAMAPEDRARIGGVFEDRSRVVEMWRQNGIVCFQVAQGEF